MNHDPELTAEAIAALNHDPELTAEAIAALRDEDKVDPGVVKSRRNSSTPDGHFTTEIVVETPDGNIIYFIEWGDGRAVDDHEIRSRDPLIPELFNFDYGCFAGEDYHTERMDELIALTTGRRGLK